MKHYEIMFIIRPTLGEDDIKKVADNFENVLKTNGGNVTNFKEMGQRELAYEINKFKNGYYFLINVDAENDEATKEFDRLARNSKDIIRHLITKIEN